MAERAMPDWSGLARGEGGVVTSNVAVAVEALQAAGIRTGSARWNGRALAPKALDCSGS